MDGRIIGGVRFCGAARGTMGLPFGSLMVSTNMGTNRLCCINQLGFEYLVFDCKEHLDRGRVEP